MRQQQHAGPVGKGPSWDLSQISVHAPKPTAAADGTAAQAERSAPVIQLKLEVGAADDPLEHEADRAADHVMSMHDPAVSVTPASPHVRRKCADREEEDKQTQQMKPVTASSARSAETPAPVHHVLRAAGQPLDAATRAFFEPRFGYDFSRVRVHADDRAAASARSIGASAYTVGSDIAFAAGRYDPVSVSGRRLLAHELAHVVQQGFTPSESSVSRPPVIRRDATSDDYRRGFEEGLNGRDPNPGPLIDDALTDYNEGYAKGHYEFTQRKASPAPAKQSPGQTGSSLQPAADAISGVHIAFLAPALPGTEATIDRFNVKKGAYLLVPQLRDAKTDTPKVVYYIAYRTDAKRNEYIIGPDSIDLFTSNLDVFRDIANTAYADPGVIDTILGFGDAIWDQQGDIATQYLHWLGLREAEKFHAMMVQEGKRIRDEQRTKQQLHTKQKIAQEVLPLINAAMLAAASVRLLAAPRAAAISDPKPPALGAEVPAEAPATEPQATAPEVQSPETQAPPQESQQGTAKEGATQQRPGAAQQAAGATGAEASTATRLGIDLDQLDPVPSRKALFKPRGGQNASAEEVALAEKAAAMRGDDIVFPKAKNQAAIDGFYRTSQQPVQLKTLTGAAKGQPAKLITRANEAYDAAAKNGWSNVDVHIEAPQMTKAQVLDRWAADRVPALHDMPGGAVARITIHCLDGVVEVPVPRGGMNAPPGRPMPPSASGTPSPDKEP